MNAAIPEEIIFFEILKRLPVKSLYRFKAVSKRWLSIITSRPFTDSHFEISKLNPTRLFGFYNVSAAPSQYYYRYNPKTSFFSTINPETSHKLLWDRYYRYCSISPRGLICFYRVLRDDATVQIWNPNTGERIEVNPKPQRKLQPGSAYYFLGFDPVGKKHKLLSLGIVDRENYVFTLGENKWRKIITSDADGSSRNLRFSCMHRSIDGIIYCLVQPNDDQNKSTNLVAFDVGSESFLETIRLPENLVVGSDNTGVIITMAIGVYRGRIVLLIDSDLRTGGMEMWVLEDVEKQKWIPKRIIPPSPPPPPSLPLFYELGVVIDGEELLIFTPFVGGNFKGFRLCRYDLEKGRWLETLFPDFRSEELDRSAMYKVMLYCYVDSLESLK